MAPTESKFTRLAYYPASFLQSRGGPINYTVLFSPPHCGLRKPACVSVKAFTRGEAFFRTRHNGIAKGARVRIFALGLWLFIILSIVISHVIYLVIRWVLDVDDLGVAPETAWVRITVGVWFGKKYWELKKKSTDNSRKCQSYENTGQQLSFATYTYIITTTSNASAHRTTFLCHSPYVMISEEFATTSEMKNRGVTRDLRRQLRKLLKKKKK